LAWTQRTKLILVEIRFFCITNTERFFVPSFGGWSHSIADALYWHLEEKCYLFMISASNSNKLYVLWIDCMLQDQTYFGILPNNFWKFTALLLNVITVLSFLELRYWGRNKVEKLCKSFVEGFAIYYERKFRWNS